MLLKEVLAYSEEEKILGTVVEYSQIKKTATLKRGDETFGVSANGLVIMEKIGFLQGTDIFEWDVFKGIGNSSDVRYIVKLEEGKIVLSTINNRLEIVKEISRFEPSELKNYAYSIDLVAHYYELKAELKTVDFNIAIVKVDGEYFYAGNNKEKEEVDMIKVIYIGASLLEEEEYLRFTLSHEEYLENVETGKYVEVEPVELAMYVAMKLRGDIVPQEAEEECGVNCGCLFKDEDKEDLCECEQELEEDCDCAEEESVAPKSYAKKKALNSDEKLDSLFD